MLLIFQILFIFAMFCFFYSTILFPIFLLTKRRKRYNIVSNYQPFVSLVISVHNEEEIIEKKIKNSMELNYPGDKLEIIVSSDGSTDKTSEICQRYVKVKFLDLAREGKTAVQNEALKHAKGEIIVFSDANILYEANAIKELVAPFSDKRVGCACGRLIYTNDKVESIYWSYETMIKILEGRIGKLVGANGGIYAVRKELYLPLENDAISDFLEPIKIYESGYDVLYVKNSIGYEVEPKIIFSRKRRIILRSLNSLRYLGKSVIPFNKRSLFSMLVPHKFIRWFMPVLLIILLVSSIFLVKLYVYRFLLFSQILFYALAILVKPVKYFVIVNSSSFMAIIDWIRGKKINIWEVER